MQETRIRVKQNAKLILKGNWLKAITIMLIIYLLAIAISALEYAYCTAFQIKSVYDIYSMATTISFNDAFISTAVTLAFTLLSLLLTTPLKLGQSEWYWKLTDRKPQGVEGIFEWFGTLRLYAKSLWLNIYIWLRSLPWMLLTIGIPFAIICGTSYLYGLDSKNTNMDVVFSIILIFGFALLLCGFIFYAYILMRYFLSKYLLVEDVSRKVTACVRDSVHYTKGKRGELFVFYLSFVGWLVLCVIGMLTVIGIPLVLYVLPYFNSSCAVYAKYMIYSSRVSSGGEINNTIEFDKHKTDHDLQE
jgi:uncharacterized membrane protein